MLISWFQVQLIPSSTDIALHCSTNHLLPIIFYTSTDDINQLDIDVCRHLYKTLPRFPIFILLYPLLRSEHQQSNHCLLTDQDNLKDISRSHSNTSNENCSNRPEDDAHSSNDVCIKTSFIKGEHSELLCPVDVGGPDTSTSSQTELDKTVTANEILLKSRFEQANSTFQKIKSIFNGRTQRYCHHEGLYDCWLHMP